MRNLLLPLLVLLWCSVLGCAPAPVGILDAGPDDVPGLEVAPDDVPVAVDAPPDAGPDAFEAPPPPDVAVAVDAAPDAPTELGGRVSLAASVFDVVSAQCSASGWGTAGGPAATFRFGLTERPPRSGSTWVSGTVSPGPVGSLAFPEERITSGVSTFFGKPYRSGAGERVDFEARGTFRAAGLVVVTVTGCPVGL